MVTKFPGIIWSPLAISPAGFPKKSGGSWQERLQADYCLSRNGNSVPVGSFLRENWLPARRESQFYVGLGYPPFWGLLRTKWLPDKGRGNLKNLTSILQPLEGRGRRKGNSFKYDCRNGEQILKNLSKGLQEWNLGVPFYRTPLQDCINGDQISKIWSPFCNPFLDLPSMHGEQLKPGR